MMTREDREKVDACKLQVKEIEQKIEEHERELESLRAKKALLLKEIGEHTDEKYEQNLLNLVYEQRKKKK
ncbi:MAG: hypothetical protein K5889_02730, partial [Lachnospiraceae bacterium]|nr:hypothetical protein [Lachnospiraceae bacterium]